MTTDHDLENISGLKEIANQAGEWHALSSDESIKLLMSDASGLDDSQVRQRAIKWGRNIIPSRRRTSVLIIILHQFLSPLIYILLAASVVSIVLGEYADAGFIFLILVINAIIGTTQEWKAEAKASELQEMVRINVKVKRNARTEMVDSELLVPGDIVLLESGNKVPADIRLINTINLNADESILTGESLPVAKHAQPILREITSVADKDNMLFAGTTISSGRGTGLVVAIGLATEIGGIASSLRLIETGKAPLVERMEFFSRKISLYVLIACIILGVLAYFNGISVKDIFFFIVAVAVSAIPEGLPIAMTVALSVGASRMAKRNVIIRKLTAVEGLGSCTFIATDKTGTLTVDQQTVVKCYLAGGSSFAVTGEGYNGNGELISDDTGLHADRDALKKLVCAITICNEGSLELTEGNWVHTGDPVDVAMLAFVFKTGTTPSAILSQVRKVKEVPFESDRKYSMVWYRDGGQLKVAVKGALERIRQFTDAEQYQSLFAKADELARNGYRVIGVAGSSVEEISGDDHLPPVEVLGFLALIDPLRPEARPAIDQCRLAGVKVAMVTGDHPSTALAIAKDVGIATDSSQVASGAELDLALKSGQGWSEFIKDKTVFARVSPHQKHQIVELLREAGHFVAVTGDGVNDAPALRTANIGVAMGYGTDVAKETASIIVTDNNFASIVAGIEEGRFTYSNLRKIIYLLVSTGAAELLMIALSLVFMLPLPFLPLQLLWLNLVTNGIQDIGLAFEAGEKGVMKELPRGIDERIFDRRMIRQTIVSASVITLLTFGLWLHLLQNLHYEESEARNIILLLMVLLQNFHVLNCRSETGSIFSSPIANNKSLVVGIIFAQLIHIVAMHVPYTQQLLSLYPVSVADWIKLFLTASIVVVAMEIFKRLNRSRKFNS